jgi:arsenite methyltransferase
LRVLKKGGRAVISDIVSDEEVPEELQNDPELWSGCISGALTEEGFLAAFENASFYGIQILKRDRDPWRTVQGIEFRSVTIEAFKGKQGECFERNQTVIYRGPFKFQGQLKRILLSYVSLVPMAVVMTTVAVIDSLPAGPVG